MPQLTDEQRLTEASNELDELERRVANLSVARKRGETSDDQQLQTSQAALELLLAPEFHITRASGKVDDRDAFLGVVTSGERHYSAHKSSIDGVRKHSEGGVLTGSIETEGDYAGKSVRGRFRFTKVFTKDGNAWKCIAWQNTAIPDDKPDPMAIRAVYEEICRAHSGISDFRAKLLALLPLASGAGLLLLLGRDPVPTERVGHLLPLGVFGACITLGLYLYELRGIQVCKKLRADGGHLERVLLLGGSDLNGAFLGRPLARGVFVGAEGASHVVYSIVIGAWGYLAHIGAANGDPIGNGTRVWVGHLTWPLLFIVGTHVSTQLISRVIDWLRQRTRRAVT
jgi:hypothetical protein